jgi:polysaccharide pyruvyl transferase WcaK-like protein
VKRLTLSGYYGYGNAGDEAVLAGLVAGFQAAPGAEERELVALSGYPAETRAAHGIRLRCCGRSGAPTCFSPAAAACCRM